MRRLSKGTMWGMLGRVAKGMQKPGFHPLAGSGKFRSRGDDDAGELGVFKSSIILAIPGNG